tara:strand:- start:44 stop:1069 length:1026 start_codon:yes stop_codon:yes gene_type:complete
MKNIILIIILVFIQKNAYCNNLFNTPFYNVEFTSNNIEKDKIKEINKIKTRSILFIFNKILNNEDYIKINKYLTDDLINTLIKNIVINDEKIINDKYLSNIKINYNKQNIIEFLRSKKIAYVEFYPDKFLLIILEKQEIGNNLFTKNNSYYEYFNKKLRSNNFFKIPNLDINDRYRLKDHHIIDRDDKKINSFSKKYNSYDNLVVISKTNKNSVSYELILYSDEKVLEKKFYINEKDMKLFYELLLSETLNMWKKINQIQNETINVLNCKINYYNLLELKEIRENLKNVSVIKNITLTRLKYKKTEYDIYYFGNLKILFKILKLNKLKINYNNSKCSIRLT